MPQNLELQNLIAQSYIDCFNKQPPLELIDISFSKNQQYHYQSAICLKVSHSLSLPPLQVATQLCASLVEKGQQAEPSAPGFINIRLQDKKLLEDLLNQVNSIADPKPKENPQTIIVDYSSPNVAKELHVGHLRSTVIGDALARAFEFLGEKVLRLNHLGDWGTAFGMLISYLKRHKCDPFDSNCDLAALMRWYQESKREFDESSDVYEHSKSQLVLLQSGDQENLKIWKRICEISEKGYALIYEQLQIEGLQSRGESFYQPYIPSLLEDLEEKNLVRVSQGATCLFLDGFYNRQGEPLPLMIQKSDGGFNYATTDLTALRYRIEQDKADKILYVTDHGQKDHFAMIFQAGKQAGYAHLEQLMHVPFGLVQNEEGKRYKTRSGSVVRLQELLDEAYQRSYAIAQERGLSEPENFAKVVGFGAIKYADLSTNRIMNYIFDFDKMLAFDGNTVVYLLYVYVRTFSLMRKASEVLPVKALDIERTLNAAEQRLVFQLNQFSQTIESAVRDANPHYLTDYLYQLCSQFNQFFRDCQVLNHEASAQRLIYVSATAQVLKKGLEILGIGTINEM